MTDEKPAPKTATSHPANVKTDDKKAKLAEQLRANLRRRKAQSRELKGND